jgi:hypothetical protein
MTKMRVTNGVFRGMRNALPIAVLMWAAIFLIVGALGGCATKPVPIETRTQTVYVDRPVACPPKTERDRLKAARPKPLRDQPKPVDPVERVGKITGQLGAYEAEGAWADQVDAALDRCQTP